MDQLGDELKKVFQAGLGAVAAGAEKVQEAVESLSKKGEPLYEQAKSAVSDAADSIKKAVSDSGIADVFSGKGKGKVDAMICALKQLPLEELYQIRAALDEICTEKEHEDVERAMADARQAAEELQQAAQAEEEKEEDKPAE